MVLHFSRLVILATVWEEAVGTLALANPDA